MNRLFALAVPLSLWLAPASGTSQPLHWPASHATHRAIFCGHPGHTETTKDYAEALLAELQRLEGEGVSGAAAWARLGRQARCEHDAKLREMGRTVSAS